MAAAEFVIAIGKVIQEHQEEAIRYLNHGMGVLVFGLVALALRSLVSPNRESLQYRIATDDMMAVLNEKTAMLQEKLAQSAYARA